MAGTEPHAWGTGRMDDITYVGLDVHKPAPRKRGATVCVAVAASGRSGEVRQIGVFENRPEIRFATTHRRSFASLFLARKGRFPDFGSPDT